MAAVNELKIGRYDCNTDPSNPPPIMELTLDETHRLAVQSLEHEDQSMSIVVPIATREPVAIGQGGYREVIRLRFTISPGIEQLYSYYAMLYNVLRAPEVYSLYRIELANNDGTTRQILLSLEGILQSAKIILSEGSNTIMVTLNLYTGRCA